MREPLAVRFVDWWERNYDRIDQSETMWIDGFFFWTAEMDLSDSDRDLLFEASSAEIHTRRFFRAEQAWKFLRMYQRAPTGDWQSAFDRWADGKDFQPADRTAIERIVQDLFLADGTCTFTDPLDYLGAA